MSVTADPHLINNSRSPPPSCGRVAGGRAACLLYDRAFGSLPGRRAGRLSPARRSACTTGPADTADLDGDSRRLRRRGRRRDHGASGLPGGCRPGWSTPDRSTGSARIWQRSVRGSPSRV
ncbi:hypothetical protein HBB16_02285 [Pseudonocardia sp. MCCB 268]|nr:hypothetical protein [Pseudonocardia cytotoxica]